MNTRTHIAKRNIKTETAQMLWAVSAGRCEFGGCNTILFRNPVTGGHGNFSQKAHIYAFSKGGRRYTNIFAREKINDIDNLMLVCGACHHEIDDDKNGELYPAEVLLSMKKAHEQRIELLTGIAPEKKTLVVKYFARVGTRPDISLHDGILNSSVIPDHYPERDYPYDLSPDISLYDHQELYWDVLGHDLRMKVNVVQQMLEGKHISLFAIAPQPLLFLLGTLFDRSKLVDVRQPRGGSVDSWNWDTDADSLKFSLEKKGQNDATDNVVLTIGLTCAILPEHIHDVCKGFPIYSVSIASPSTNCIKTQQHLHDLSLCFRQALNAIRTESAENVCIHLFVAAPASVSIQLGRHWMEKGDPMIVFYDRNPQNNGYHQVMTFGGAYAND